MNALTLDLIRTAQAATGDLELTGAHAAFLAKLVELVAGRCADIADSADVYQTYNIGGEICESFGLTAE
jgi:hypothetical protein